MKRRRYLTRSVVIVLAAVAAIAIALAARHHHWDATAAMLAGILAAAVIWWQGSLLKEQIAFSTFIEFDKEWNSREMIETRQKVRDEQERWNISRLEGVLEFFEKLASFRRLGVLDFDLLYESTLGWYAVRYFLFAREEIRRIRTGVWKDENPPVYTDLEAFYNKYLDEGVGRDREAREEWEAKRKKTEATFFGQERED